MSGTINRNVEFGVPIFNIDLKDCEQHRQTLIDHFLTMRDNDPGSQRSNQGGWHSREDLFKSNHPSVQWLVRTIFTAGLESVKQGGLLPQGQTLAMSTCWVNINESGDWNAPHNHFPDEWSGVCYIDVNSKDPTAVKTDRDGDIIFLNPLPLGLEHQRAVSITATPQNGKLFFFPSYLVHMVAPHFEQKPRISVAFNLTLKPNPGG